MTRVVLAVVVLVVSVAAALFLSWRLEKLRRDYEWNAAYTAQHWRYGTGLAVSAGVAVAVFAALIAVLTNP